MNNNRFSNLLLSGFGFDEDLIPLIERTLASCERDAEYPQNVTFTVPQDISLSDSVEIGDALSIIADNGGWERGPVIRSAGMRSQAFILPHERE